MLTSYDRTLVIKQISSEEVADVHNILSEYHQVALRLGLFVFCFVFLSQCEEDGSDCQVGPVQRCLWCDRWLCSHPPPPCSTSSSATAARCCLSSWACTG